MRLIEPTDFRMRSTKILTTVKHAFSAFSSGYIVLYTLTLEQR